MRRALLGAAALGSLLLVTACGSDDDVDTSIPSVDSVLDTLVPEDSSVTGDTMSPVDTTMTGDSMMTTDTASSATVAP